MNFPLSAGSGAEEYIAIFKDKIVPELSKYKPGLLLISAGFDAHKDDPLGGMLLTDHLFADMTRMVNGLAPVVSVLEGGYNLEALAHSVEQHLNVLLDG